ncbi:MAG: acetylxylan esterase [Opitutaceae bacterium]|nr:acetylxylan esterase [Opitutaceae bacterium]
MLKRIALVLCSITATAAGLAAEKFVPNYDETRVPPYTLPNPLVCADGTAVRDAATWRNQRRPELLELFSREVYGRTPAGRPAKMHWAVTSTDRAALGGKAVRKEVTIWFTEKKDGPQMRLLMYQPVRATRQAPVPAFLGLNFNGNQCVSADPGITISDRWVRTNAAQKVVNNRVTKESRGLSARAWDVETVVARGYATATVYYGDLCEDRVEGFSRDVAPLFNTGSVEERRPDAWGAIGIWAWGLSRALDYLQSDPEIDGKRVAVHGHSRLGKTALWAGAQDERFAMVISNDSGCGGAALSLRRFGETVERINVSFPHWFAKNFRRYNAHEEALPVDQHELIALAAPRPLHVASAEGDPWADPRGEFLGAKHAEPVYALFGKKGLGVADMPRVDFPVLGDGLAYHIRTGPHAITAYDWAQYLDFADRMMQK